MPLPYAAPPFSDALHREYCASIYVCHNFRLRPGLLNASFDEWIAGRGATSYAFVTAYNPYSTRQGSRADNLARAQVLSKWVRNRSINHHPAAAVDGSGEWPEEVGLLLVGVSLGTALEAGIAMEQNAILWGEVGQAPTVLWCVCGVSG